MNGNWRMSLARAAAFYPCRSGVKQRSSAYSVLTHEEIVDLLWTSEIRPLLLQRFPG